MEKIEPACPRCNSTRLKRPRLQVPEGVAVKIMLTCADCGNIFDEKRAANLVVAEGGEE